MMDILIMLMHICAVVVCVLGLAYYFKVSVAETMPVFVCGLVLVLYILAVLRHLSWIDILAAVVIVLSLIWLMNGTKQKRGEFFKACLENMTQPSSIAAIFTIAVVVILTSGKVVSWWDDINFWASDVKSLYFLDGFADKYANVSPEFGDYPPGAQLIKWWFLHMSPHVFQEGLAFAGYHTMNMVFLFPLFKKLKGRNVPVMFLTAAALWMLPSIAEVYGYSGFCADLTMACVYGGFLLAVTELGECSGEHCDRRTRTFRYGRCALYLSVLVLIKSIGFVWALFGIVFMMLYLRGGSGTKERAVNGMNGTVLGSRKRKSGKGTQWLPVVVTAAAPILTGGSWLLFCLVMRRVTKTTATAVKYMTTDEYGISGYTREFARAFVRAFAGLPLHKDRTAAIDLTPLLFYLCICLIVIIFYKTQIMPREKGKTVLCFTIVSGALFYMVIFVAHITIFATETQYLEAEGMISSIERYGAPFTVGTLIFLAGIWLKGADRLFEHVDVQRRQRIGGFVSRYGAYLCLILFVALTAGYQVGYDGLVGYRSDTQTRLEERAEMLGGDERMFLEAIQALGTDSSTRVCYIRRGDAPRWVNNSYAAYEASPVSVVFKSVNLNDAPTDFMIQEIRASHAAYLYVEETDQDAGAVFDRLTDGGAFTCGVLYQIEDDGMEMKLTKVSQ